MQQDGPEQANGFDYPIAGGTVSEDVAIVRTVQTVISESVPVQANTSVEYTSPRNPQNCESATSDWYMPPLMFGFSSNFGASRLFTEDTRPRAHGA